MIRVSFSDCPSHYVRPGSTYRALVESAMSLPTEVVSERADIHFWSVHPSRLTRVRGLAWDAARFAGVTKRRGELVHPKVEFEIESSANVWFTGENVRPPVGPWDGYLSFDHHGLGGRNVYFPYWFDYVGSVGRPYVNFTGLDMAPDDYLTQRVPGARSRPGFVAAFIGNATSMRWHAIETLRAVGRVDVYGDAVGRPVQDKARVGRDYRFVLCMENDLYPGYVTEKVFDAWAMGAIPIWWGDDSHRYLNPKAMINLANFESFDAAADYIRRIDTDPDTFDAINSRALLLREANTGAAQHLIQRVLEARV